MRIPLELSCLREPISSREDMSYVGWKDMKSALRYVDASSSFGGLAAYNAGEIERDR